MAKAKKQSRIVLTQKGFELQFNFGNGWKTEMTLLILEDTQVKENDKVHKNGLAELLTRVNHHMYIGCEFIGFIDETDNLIEE